MGSSMMNADISRGTPKWSSCGGVGDLANSWRMLVKLGFLRSDVLCRSEKPSSSMRTRLANDGMSSKNLFTFVSCLNTFLLLLPNMSSRKIYFWQDWVNAGSARYKLLRSLSEDGKVASFSTIEASSSFGRREKVAGLACRLDESTQLNFKLQASFKLKKFVTVTRRWDRLYM